MLVLYWLSRLVMLVDQSMVAMHTHRHSLSISQLHCVLINT